MQKRIVIGFCLLLPGLLYGQLNIQARVTTRKLPDMTIREYMYGPVKADTAYIGEKRYLVPAYEEPRFSELAKIFWIGRILNRLNNGLTLSADGLIIAPGSAAQNVESAVAAAGWLAGNSWGIVTAGSDTIYAIKK